MCTFLRERSDVAVAQIKLRHLSQVPNFFRQRRQVAVVKQHELPERKKIADFGRQRCYAKVRELQKHNVGSEWEQPQKNSAELVGRQVARHLAPPPRPAERNAEPRQSEF
jgi:hypothetical protein